MFGLWLWQKRTAARVYCQCWFSFFFFCWLKSFKLQKQLYRQKKKKKPSPFSHPTPQCPPCAPHKQTKYHHDSNSYWLMSWNKKKKINPEQHTDTLTNCFFKQELRHPNSLHSDMILSLSECFFFFPLHEVHKQHHYK